MNLQQLIAQGEHQQQDFKYEISSISKIAHSLSAFANSEGGRLLIGVKDNGAIAGVHGDEEMYMVEAAATTHCVPPITCHMQAYRAEGKVVVIAQIDPAMTPPVRAREEDGRLCAYMRIKDENIVAPPVQMALWRIENAPQGALLQVTAQQQQLLHVLAASNNGLTLNQCARQAAMPRHHAINLLAYLIEFGLVRQVFINHTFYYLAESEEAR